MPKKLQVSFAQEPKKRDYILQKRPAILRSLLIVATPYLDCAPRWTYCDCAPHSWVTNTHELTDASLCDTHELTNASLCDSLVTLCAWFLSHTDKHSRTRIHKSHRRTLTNTHSWVTQTNTHEHTFMSLTDKHPRTRIHKSHRQTLMNTHS